MKRGSSLLTLITTSLCIASLMLIAFASCSPSGGITGTITGGTYPTIGLFDETHDFDNDFFDTVNTDVITDENNGTPPYSPVETVSIDSGTFSVNLPQGTNGMKRALVAWDDTDQNGKFDFQPSLKFIIIRPDFIYFFYTVSWNHYTSLKEFHFDIIKLSFIMSRSKRLTAYGLRLKAIILIGILVN